MSVPYDDSDLDFLVEKIAGGNVVPVIGSRMINVIINGKTLPLMDYLLEKLEQKYADRKLTFNYGADLNSAEEKLNYIHAYTTSKKISFYSYIKELMKDIEPLCDDSSLKQLANIRKFKFFLNASFTNVLERSLTESRSKIAGKIDSYSLDIYDSPLTDIIIEPALNALSPVGSPQKLKKTVVYNLYGNHELGLNFIAVDDDILELVHTISSNKEKLNTLYELLCASSLLFIGCDFPDWLLRFFIRMFSPRKLSANNSLYTVADNLNILADRNRAIFISNSTMSYFDLTGNDFVDFLHKRIERTDPAWIRNNDQQNYIFISYLTTNQPKVIEIYEKLEENDFDVYMDINVLEDGDDVNPGIKESIKNCKIFMPIVSKETNSALHANRYFKKEWEYALSLHEAYNPKNEMNKSPFILPVFLDTIKENEVMDGTPSRFFELKYQAALTDYSFTGFIKRIKEILDSKQNGSKNNRK